MEDQHDQYKQHGWNTQYCENYGERVGFESSAQINCDPLYLVLVHDQHAHNED